MVTTTTTTTISSFFCSINRLKRIAYPERIQVAAKNADKMTLEEVIVAGQSAFIQMAGGLDFIISRDNRN